MAAAEGGSQVGESWPKWQIALAVGAPVVVGAAGLWLYRRHKSSATGKDKKEKTDSSAAVKKIEAESQASSVRVGVVIHAVSVSKLSFFSLTMV
jgi:hypothetical protein